MTKQRSFKRLVRARMAKTGESYTTARAGLLGPADATATSHQVPLVTSDDAIRARTGRGWEEWFDLLDEWGADRLEHREVARLVASELDIHPLAWAAQAVTTSYERARGGRLIGQHADGFAVTASRTVNVPVTLLFGAFADPSQRAGWLADDQLRERTATKPTSIRFDWADGTTRVNVTFAPKDDGRSTVSLEHARLGEAADVERMKPFWRAALLELKARLEAGAIDA